VLLFGQEVLVEKSIACVLLSRTKKTSQKVLKCQITNKNAHSCNQQQNRPEVIEKQAHVLCVKICFNYSLLFATLSFQQEINRQVVICRYTIQRLFEI
jgi:hypothetical protein